MTPRDSMKAQGRDKVGLALTNQRVVLKKVFLIELIAAGLSVEDSSSFGSVKVGKISQHNDQSMRQGCLRWDECTHGETFSNWRWVPKARLASLASSAPEVNLGPVFMSAEAASALEARRKNLSAR